MARLHTILAGLRASSGLSILSASLATAFFAKQSSSFAEPSLPSPYRVFRGNGSPSTLQELVSCLKNYDIVLIGEVHDDPIAHDLELEILKRAIDAHAPSRRLALSLEQFESDTQAVLDEYLQGLLRERDFTKDARAWPNYDRDYRPLVELCKARGLDVIAANAPRRYVALAGREGRAALESKLPLASRSFLPPFPYAQPSRAYVAKIDALMRAVRGEDPSAAPPSSSSPSPPPTSSPSATAKECPYIGLSVSSKFLDAQVLWDATMAHRIASYLHRHTPSSSDSSSQATGATGMHVPTPARDPSPSAPSPSDPSSTSTSSQTHPPLILHVCGKAHMEGRLGIPEHLAVYAPAARVLTVAIEPIPGEVLGREDLRSQDTADYVIATNGDLPRSFASEHV